MQVSDFTDLVAAGATIAAAGVGAYFSGKLGHRNAEARSRGLRRIELADAAITAALKLRGALHISDPGWTVRSWSILVEDVRDALSAAAPVLPPGMRHLRRSIGAACGEALGLAGLPELADVRETYELADFDVEWSTNARDYLDVTVRALRLWREATETTSMKVTAPTFDDWLRSTGRFHAGLKPLS